MNVASLELCKELYELSGWEYTEERRHIEKVWMELFNTWEMGQGNPDYASTPPEKRRGYEVGAYRVTDNPRNHIGIPEHVPWGWANQHYREVEARAVPAYDLGYLLRKLPHYDNNGWDLLLKYEGQDWVEIGYFNLVNKNWKHSVRESESPENAAAKLAIELLKQGILTKKVPS